MDRVQIRQGDLLLVPIERLPEGANLEHVKGDRIVLAEGEATGHSHTISRRSAKSYRIGTHTGNNRFLRVTQPTVLRHQEHDPLTVPAGDWLIVPQHEYQPGAIVRVAD